LAAHGVQTNNAGTLCLVLAVTNRSNKIYGVDFATQTKSAGGWVSPSRIKRFDACDGEQLQPSSGCEVLVPVPQTGVPWRVVVAYGEHDQRPTGSLRKLWRLCRLCMRFRLREMKFLTSPGMSSNKLIEPMTSSAVLLVLQSSVNGALLVTAHPRR
jgi:hypothetical protein